MTTKQLRERRAVDLSLLSQSEAIGRVIFYKHLRYRICEYGMRHIPHGPPGRVEAVRLERLDDGSTQEPAGTEKWIPVLSLTRMARRYRLEPRVGVDSLVDENGTLTGITAVPLAWDEAVKRSAMRVGQDRA